MEEDRAGSPAKYVFVGDYVDRGPDSAGVVQFLMDKKAFEKDVEHVFLRGNHEDMLIDYHRQEWTGNGAYFLYNGGDATLASYKNMGIQVKDHLDFYSKLRWYWSYGQVAVVHAALDPSEPDLDHQKDQILIWERDFDLFDDDYAGGWFVVRGHTPIAEGKPVKWKNQINVDTGCVFGLNRGYSFDYGFLTAVKIESPDDSFKNDGSLTFQYLQVEVPRG